MVKKYNQNSLSSEPTNIFTHKNLSFLIPCIHTFGDAFPIIKNEDLCQAITALNPFDLSFQVKVGISLEVSELACRTIFWACLAIGAVLQGNDTAAGTFLKQSTASFAMHENVASHITSRAHLVVCLMFKCLGDENNAIIQLSRAELVTSQDNRGSLKALQMFILPLSTVFASLERFMFSLSELENFSFDSRVFYCWTLLYNKYAILQDGKWEFASDCYHNIILAETSLKMKKDYSVRNWYRLQRMLIVLEICHLSLLEQGTNRAREIVTFLSKNPDFFVVLEKLQENLSMTLLFVAQVFHKIKDHIFYDLTSTLWRAATKGEGFLPLLDGEWVGVSNSVVLHTISKKIDQVFGCSFVGPRRMDSLDFPSNGHMGISSKTCADIDVHQALAHYHNKGGSIHLTDQALTEPDIQDTLSLFLEIDEEENTSDHKHDKILADPDLKDTLFLLQTVEGENSTFQQDQRYAAQTDWKDS